MIARPVLIAPVTLSNVATFKDVRLRALLDTPTAFGSTYAREREFTDAEWVGRAERWNGERGIGFLAIDDGRGCGIAGSLIEDATPTRATLVSMWTAPTHRRRGIAWQLVDRVAAWALEHGARELLLLVTSSNGPAITFYERLGFARTGLTEPYPNDPSLVELEMRREL